MAEKLPLFFKYDVPVSDRPSLEGIMNDRFQIYF